MATIGNIKIPKSCDPSSLLKSARDPELDLCHGEWDCRDIDSCKECVLYPLNRKKLLKFIKSKEFLARCL